MIANIIVTIGLAVSAVILIVIVIVIGFVRPYRYQKLIEDTLARFDGELYVLKKVLDRPYNYELITPNVRYLVKIVNPPKHAQLTINARETLYIRWGGNPEPGQLFKNKRHMEELTSFLELPSNERIVKILVFSPDLAQVVSYRNESDLDVVDCRTRYDYYVINLSDFETKITEVLHETQID